MEIKAQVEAGIQWRHPVIGRGLNENETSTNEVSYKSSPCSLDPGFCWHNTVFWTESLHLG
jgi:hypothetical protein